MQSFEEYCKDFINDKLEEYIGITVYGADLGFTLTEGINSDGTATYSKQKAMEYIKEWFDEAGEVYQYQVDNYGKACQNPFENPEAWMVCMIIEGVNNLLGQCETVENFWNDEKEITEELMENIKSEVQDLSICF